MDALRGKSILITGASGGLGAALAQALAGAGARLTLMARRAEPLEEVARSCRRRGGEALTVVGDVADPEDGRRLTAEAVVCYGGVDGLVANAGMSMWARFDEVEQVDLFRRLVEVNYLGAVYCLHPALPHLRQRQGIFVAISSIQGKIGVPNHTGYAASKHALQGFCDALRMELEGSGVDVLTVLLHWLRGTDLRRNAFGADGRPVGESSRQHSGDSVGLEQACAAILKAMVEGERELVLPWKLKALLGLKALRPRAAEAIVRRAVKRQRE